ncbi:hypothetical protein MXD81_25050, partial [Microbacteriaceae bacterium K1510]|nr:hypothetical protein [Microbacteriaceae bacterium K1510]
VDRFVERAGMPSAGHIKNLDTASFLSMLQERIAHLDRERAIVAEKSRQLAREAAKSSELVLQALGNHN